MRTVIPTRLAATTVAAVASLTFCPAQEQGWLTDFDEAQAVAKKEQKPILANFTGSDWCGWCIKLKAEVFSKPEFEEWAAQNVVLLELDFPRRKQLPEALAEQNRELAQRYGIRGYPTVLLLDADGEQRGKLGYLRGGPEAWIAAAEAQLGENADEVGWTTDYQAALRRAKEEDKLVMANFTGSDWCGWCIKLKGEVFSKPEFEAWAAEHVVLLELDFPKTKQLPGDLEKQNVSLRDKYGVRGYPTLLFLDPKGEVVAKSGYVRGGPTRWIADAEKKLGIEKKERDG